MAVHEGRFQDICDDDFRERERQEELHGDTNWQNTVTDWHLIVTEELGEAAQAVLKGQKAQYRREMIETAASIIAAIEAFDRDYTPPHFQQVAPHRYEGLVNGREILVERDPTPFGWRWYRVDGGAAHASAGGFSTARSAMVAAIQACSK